MRILWILMGSCTQSIATSPGISAAYLSWKMRYGICQRAK